MMRRRSSLFLSAGSVRALLEALLLGLLVWGVVSLFPGSRRGPVPFINAYALADPVFLLWFALRLRSFAGRWRRRAILAALIGCGLSIALTALFRFLFDTTYIGTLSEYSRLVWPLTFVVLILNYVAFIVGRVGPRVLLFWDRLRRRQLIWALTHAQVMVVAFGAGVVIIAADLFLIISRKGPTFALISTTIGLLILSVIIMVAIVPPSAIFSYFAMRRTINRVQTLTMATATLRRGNYAVRVPVKGADEVAQLQTDFNTMAAALERAMHELQQERDTVASLLQSRRELIASVSHELRTPVATLRGYLETTLIHWDEISLDTLHHDLVVMEDEVVHLQKLVEDLFTLARSEVGRLSLQCKPTDVGEIVRHMVDAGAPLAWRKNKIDLVAEVSSAIPPVTVDPTRLEQALQNLIHNGLRHTPPGGIIAIVVLKERGAVVIQVKDTGEGIAQQDLPHIWERFYQSDGARTGMGGGSGLGLALVKEWVEAMGGTVGVESILGEGSCFSIHLPLAQEGELVKSEA
jgi:signal transduction histidine kinase